MSQTLTNVIAKALLRSWAARYRDLVIDALSALNDDSEVLSVEHRIFHVASILQRILADLDAALKNWEEHG